MSVFETISSKVTSTPYLHFPGFLKNPSVFIAEKMETCGDFFRVNAPGNEIWAVANTDEFVQRFDFNLAGNTTPIPQSGSTLKPDKLFY